MSDYEKTYHNRRMILVQDLAESFLFLVSIGRFMLLFSFKINGEFSAFYLSFVYFLFLVEDLVVLLSFLLIQILMV